MITFCELQNFYQNLEFCGIIYCFVPFVRNLAYCLPFVQIFCS